MPSLPVIYQDLSQEDLYRFGNASSPRLDNVRQNDVQTHDKDGTLFIRADGTGISLLTEQGAANRPGWLWRIPRETAMPHGLALNNNRPGHYFLCPTTDLSMDRYRTLLGELALRCDRVKKQ